MGLTLPFLRHQVVRGLCAHGHQIVNFFNLVSVLASVLRKCASRKSKWLLCKSLQAINVGEGVEKREPSYTVGGNVN